MEYKALNQTQLRFVSTIDTTVNISNNPSKMDWGKFVGAPFAFKEGGTAGVINAQLDSSGTTTSNGTNIIGIQYLGGSGNVNNWTNTSVQAYYTKSVFVDGTYYHGYNICLYRSQYFYYYSTNEYLRYSMPKGKYVFLIYRDSTKTIETVTINHGGLLEYVASGSSNSRYIYSGVTVAKAASDVVLSIFFEADPVSVTKELTGCTVSDNTTDGKFDWGQVYTATITPASGHTLTNATVKVVSSTSAKNVTLSSGGDYTWDKTTGMLTVPASSTSSALTITIECPEG